MIVNFAVKYDHDIAIVGFNWLVAGREIDNFQACRAQRGDVGTENALLIRPTM